MPGFQLSPDFDWTIDTESTHPLSATLSTAYCESEKRLFTVSVAGDDEEPSA